MSITFITPISPDHQQFLPACTASVREQTAPCQHLVMLDEDRRGPGFIRNRLLAQAETEYVSFLDADDLVEPDFAEKMLAAAHTGAYVYSDWWQDDHHVVAPERAWCARTFHLVTAVVPLQLARWVGGFDEDMAGLEDTDFFLKLISRDLCGRRVPYPLVHYRANGGRGDAVHRSGQVDALRMELSRRYGGKALACCGSDTVINEGPIGERQDGDVLAMARWMGNRTERGRATGRRYPRSGNHKRVWVDPRDVAASPSLWEPAPPEVAL